MHGVICAGVILSVMGAAFFFYVLCAPHPWPVCLVCAGTDWLVPKSPVAFHTLGLGLLPVCITPSTPPLLSFRLILSDIDATGVKKEEEKAYPALRRLCCSSPVVLGLFAVCFFGFHLLGAIHLWVSHLGGQDGRS